VTVGLREKTRKFIEAAGKIVRRYQVDTTLKCLKLLEHGSFILKVPQGTGKSLISQMIIRHRLDNSRVPDAKALVIVPTIELRKQYVRLAEWFGRKAGDSVGRNVVELDESKGDWRDFKNAVQTFPLLVVTPKFLANRLKHMKDFWNQIDLCILDEVDLWAVIPIDQEEARTHKYMETIFPVIRERRIPIVGLTGTPLSQETQNLFKKFDCHKIFDVPSADIGKFLPRIKIVLVPCIDKRVTSLSDQISKQIDELEMRLRKKLGIFDLDIYSLVKRCCANGDPLAQQIRNLWGQRTRLHEDMTDQGPLVSSGKQKALQEIIKQKTGVLVYAREVQMVEHLAKIKIPRRTIGIAHATSNRQNIEKFQSGILDALIMTRSLGLRGLDFPDADSLILLSAKQCWKVMDQEMCRIRGQRRHRPLKCVYIFYYKDTYEQAKAWKVTSRLLKIKDGNFKRYSLQP
jgi:superfamily II DNA or RNA helicase